MGGPLSQMTEAVNKIDNGSNQTNTVNGIGGSGSGLSNSNEFFSNNKVTFYFGLPNKKTKSFLTNVYKIKLYFIYLSQLGPQTPYTPGMPATPHTPGSSTNAGISKMNCSPSPYSNNNNNMPSGLHSNQTQHQQV